MHRLLVGSSAAPNINFDLTVVLVELLEEGGPKLEHVGIERIKVVGVPDEEDDPEPITSEATPEHR